MDVVIPAHLLLTLPNPQLVKLSALLTPVLFLYFGLGQSLIVQSFYRV